MSHFDRPPTPTSGVPSAPLLRIQEVAALLGLTTRTIRYYEELGLLEPAGRTGGDYRQYDADDVERLRFIKGLRDDAGFSLAEIGQLLEDEAARARNRARFRTTTDAAERRALVGGDSALQVLVTPAIDYLRYPNLLNTDLRAARSFKVNAITLRGIIDAFNIFNANTALVRNNNITSPTFNALAQNLSPRIFRIGVVVGF